MKSLYIGSTSGYAGKTLITVCMGLYFQQIGLNVGYMKPVGVLPYTSDNKTGDKDAKFVQEILG